MSCRPLSCPTVLRGTRYRSPLSPMWLVPSSQLVGVQVANCLTWTVYGFVKDDVWIYGPNVVGLALGAFSFSEIRCQSDHSCTDTRDVSHGVHTCMLRSCCRSGSGCAFGSVRWMQRVRCCDVAIPPPRLEKIVASEVKSFAQKHFSCAQVLRALANGNFNK